MNTPDSAKLPLTEARIVEVTQSIDFANVRARIQAAEERYERHKRDAIRWPIRSERLHKESVRERK